MPIKKITKCPLGKKLKPKDKKCKKCEYYNPRKWFNKGKEVDVFCGYMLTNIEKKYLK